MTVILSRHWLLLILVAAGTSAGVLILHRTSLGDLIHQHIADKPRRRLFLASISFFSTFATARLLAYSIHHDIGPFHNVYVHGRHLHHLVWGILILLAVGYGWLVEWGEGHGPYDILLGRTMSLLFGAGAALTLDEFALWLNLEDVYWAREGRSSIDAVILFGALLLIGIWGKPLFKAIVTGRVVPRPRRAR